MTVFKDNKELFAERLNYACELSKTIPPLQKGMQTVIRKHIGVSQETVRKWLNGEAIPRYDKIQKLSSLLECSPQWLAFGDGEPPSGTGTNVLKVSQNASSFFNTHQTHSIKPIAHITIINLEHAHNYRTLLEQKETSDTIPMIQEHIEYTESFAVIISDHNYPPFISITPGNTHLICSPTAPLAPGDLILCRIKEKNYLRQYQRITGTRYRLQSLNPNEGFDVFNNEHRINIFAVAYRAYSCKKIKK